MEHLGARAVDIGQAQQHGMDIVYVVVDFDDLLGSQVGDLVDAFGVSRSLFADGQRHRLAVLTARSGVYDAGGWVVVLAGFHHNGRALDIDVNVRERVGQAEDVVYLPGQVKDEILSLDQVVHHVRITNVTKVDRDALADRLDVEQVATVTGNHGVGNGDVCAQLDQRQRQIAADKAHATRDQGTRALEGVKRSHRCSTATAL